MFFNELFIESFVAFYVIEFLINGLLKNISLIWILIMKIYCNSWEFANNRIKRVVVGSDLYVEFF